MKPDFIGIGAQKSGTTWIYRALDEHPDICLAYGIDEKDTRFFSHYYDRGYEWYEKHFERRDSHLAVGEISTSYFFNSDVPDRIRAYRSDMKLIVSLRNPIDRAFSHHQHEVRLGRATGVNVIFENALANNPMYVNQGMYFSHLSRWLQPFDIRNVLVLIFDDLIDNPAKFATDLYCFLGVDSNFEPTMLNTRINVAKSKRNSGLTTKARQFASIARHMRLGFAVDLLKPYTNRLSSNMQESYSVPPMRAETLAMLSEKFSIENEMLAKLLGRDLSIWS